MHRQTIKRGGTRKTAQKKMETFKFSNETTDRIVKAFNSNYGAWKGNIDDIMALSSIQKYYGCKCWIRVFKTYINEIIYVLYEDEDRIIAFNNEKEAYKFILAL